MNNQTHYPNYGAGDIEKRRKCETEALPPPERRVTSGVFGVAGGGLMNPGPNEHHLV